MTVLSMCCNNNRKTFLSLLNYFLKNKILSQSDVTKYGAVLFFHIFEKKPSFSFHVILKVLYPLKSRFMPLKKYLIEKSWGTVYFIYFFELSQFIGWTVWVKLVRLCVFSFYLSDNLCYKHFKIRQIMALDINYYAQSNLTLTLWPHIST